MSLKIKISMIGKIQNRPPVADTMIMQLQLISFAQRVCDTSFFISRKSHAAVAIFQRKCDAIVSYSGLPQTLVPSLFFMAVEIVLTVICVQPPCLPLQFKCGAPDPVGIRTDHGTEKAGILQIVLPPVKAQHHIRSLSFSVRANQPDQNCAHICHCCLHSIFIGNGIQIDFSSIRI